MFNIAGEAQAKSVPLSNESRTYGIALKIHYANEGIAPETHYQEFNCNTDKKQSVCLSVIPENLTEKINYVAIAFVYSYNKNTMTAYNAMLNIASASEFSTSESNDSPADTNDDDYVDYEVIEESVDTSKIHMVTSSTYDSTGKLCCIRN